MKTMTRLAMTATLLLSGCSLVVNSGDYTGGSDGGVSDTGVSDTGTMDTGPGDASTDGDFFCTPGTSCGPGMICVGDGSGVSCVPDLDAGGMMCSGPMDCGPLQFCDLMSGTCQPEPMCAPSCAGPCVHGSCLDPTGEACLTDPLGFLVRGGPVPTCGGAVPPGARVMVPGRGEALRVGPYPVARVTDAYSAHSLRVFWDDANPDSTRLAWSEGGEIHVGELRAFSEGSTPETCVVRTTGLFVDMVCPTESFDASANVFDIEELNATTVAAFATDANIGVFHQNYSGCFAGDFSVPVTTSVNSLAIFGDTSVTVAYWNGGALSLASSGRTRALAPSVGIPSPTPLVGAGSFLLFGLRDMMEPMGPAWPNTLWNSGWALEKTVPLGDPQARVSASSPDFGTIFTGWANTGMGRVEHLSRFDCTAPTSCTPANGRGATLTSTSPLPLSMAADPGGGALVAFGDAALTGELMVKLSYVDADGDGRPESVPLLTEGEIDGSISDILDVVVTTNRGARGAAAWEVVYGVALKVMRGDSEFLELWGGTLRFCGSPPPVGT